MRLRRYKIRQEFGRFVVTYGSPLRYAAQFWNLSESDRKLLEALVEQANLALPNLALMRKHFRVLP